MQNKNGAFKLRVGAIKLHKLSDADKQFYNEFLAARDIKPNATYIDPEIEKEFFEQLKRIDSLKADIKELGSSGTITGADEIIKNLERASPSEKMLVLDVLEQFTEYVYSAAPDEKEMLARKNDTAVRIAEFLKGGQIIFPDEGAGLYGKWSKFNKQNLVSREGASSHKSADKQFAVRGPFVKEALFGTRIGSDGKKYTWLQLESHPTGLRYLLGHMISYVIYKITGKNIGPYGRSQYTEKSPMNLKEQQLKVADSFIGILDKEQLKKLLQLPQDTLGKLSALSVGDKWLYAEFTELQKGRNIEDASEIARDFFAMQVEISVLKEDIKNLGLPGTNEILKNLEKASLSERMLTLDVLELFTKYVYSAPDEKNMLDRKKDVTAKVAEFLKGGQIIFPDEGAGLYGKWSKFNKQNLVSRKGASSHQSEDEQFAVRGPFVKEALFGTRKDAAGNKHTWLQLESHPTGLRYLLGHLLSYVIYKITGKNIGPYGRSEYTEKAPLNLNKTPALESPGITKGQTESTHVNLNEKSALESPGITKRQTEPTHEEQPSPTTRLGG
ncbi:hypothetical protein GAMM_10053 [Gammaproteobacteria bacterium]